MKEHYTQFDSISNSGRGQRITIFGELKKARMMILADAFFYELF
jgi:hypothetical protein